MMENGPEFVWLALALNRLGRGDRSDQHGLQVGLPASRAGSGPRRGRGGQRQAARSGRRRGGPGTRPTAVARPRRCEPCRPRPAGGVDVVSLRQVPLSDGAPVEADVAPGDLTTILYTSGTTGPSKGAMIANKYWFDATVSTNDRRDIRPTDVFYVSSPMFHAAPHGWCASTTALTTGSRSHWTGASRSATSGTESAITRPPRSSRCRRCTCGCWPRRLPPTTRTTRPACGVPCRWRPSCTSRSRNASASTTSGSRTARPRHSCSRRPTSTGPTSRARPAGPAPASSWPSSTSTTTCCRPTRRVSSSCGLVPPQSIMDGYWDNAEASLRAFRNLWYHTVTSPTSTPTARCSSSTAGPTTSG